MSRLFKIVLLLVLIINLKAMAQYKTVEMDIKNEFYKIEGKYSLAYKNLKTGKTLFINENENFHAASTMKTPVMIELFKQVEDKKISLEDSVLIENKFRSIVDGSSYSMDFGVDSDDIVYKNIGKKMSVYDLCYLMITVSSNFATNILIEKVGAQNTNNYMHKLGAKNIQVLRGVEDLKAFNLGKNNTTTAKDMLVIFEKLASGKLKGNKKMMEILFDQKFNEIIPELLPKGTKVAHKTGSVNGVQHDTAIVYPEKGNSYILILLTKELKNENAGVKAMQQVSKLVYDYNANL